MTTTSVGYVIVQMKNEKKESGEDMNEKSATLH